MGRIDDARGGAARDQPEAVFRRRRVTVLAAAGATALVLGGLAGWVTAPDDEAATDVSVRAATTIAGADDAAGSDGSDNSDGSASTTASAPTSRAPSSGPLRSQTGNGEAVTLVFGGDVHFDGPLATTLRDDPAAILGGLQPVVRDADVAVVNLETAIGTGGRKVPKAFNFLAPPSAFDALTGAGVDVIAMANNHALDYGQDGLLQTLGAASEKQAPIIGIGGNELAAFAPAKLDVRGQRIAVINATSVIDGNLVGDWTATADHPGVASADRTDSLLTAVREARKDADTVVVFLHWGTEKNTCPNADQSALAPKLVDAGADVVVGGHAHRVLAGGYLGHAYVDYGLGNLVFKASAGAGRETGLLRLTVTGRRVDSAEWLPGRIGGSYTPSLLQGGEAAAAVQKWNGLRACSGLADAPADRP